MQKNASLKSLTELYLRRMVINPNFPYFHIKLDNKMYNHKLSHIYVMTK